jgi:hypothetical protein
MCLDQKIWMLQNISECIGMLCMHTGFSFRTGIKQSGASSKWKGKQSRENNKKVESSTRQEDEGKRGEERRGQGAKQYNIRRTYKICQNTLTTFQNIQPSKLEI